MVKLFNGEAAGGVNVQDVIDKLNAQTPVQETMVDALIRPEDIKSSADVPESFQNKMFGSIQSIMSQEPVMGVQVYFKAGKSGTKALYTLDDSRLKPSPATMVGPGFERKYKAQLGKVLTTDDLNEGEMMELISLYALISKGQYPVELKSQKYVKLLPKIVVAMNTFFNEYRAVLRGMYTMFSSNMQAKADEAKTQEVTHA